MLARLLPVMLALLLLAAPAGDVVAEAEVASAVAAIDDDPVAVAMTTTRDAVAPRVAPIPPAAEAIRPAPTLARVFRPPRPPFD